MNPGVYLDMVAMAPPLIGLWSLFRHEVSITGFSAGSVARLNIGFLAAVVFDALRLQGFGWAEYGLLFSLGMVFNGVGTLAFNLYFSPENRSLTVLLRSALRHLEFYIYHGVIVAWLIANIFFSDLYLPLTLALMTVLLSHPTRLFRLAGRRAKIPEARDMLTILQVSWVSVVTVAFLFFAFGAEPPILGISIPFAWELAFSSTSTFFFLMSKAVTNPLGLTKIWASLVPGTVVKLGQRYVVLHDAGDKARSLLSASFSSLIEAGVRVVIADPASSSLLGKTLSTDQRFGKWEREGKLVKVEADSTEGQVREKASEFLRLRTVGTVYVVELLDGKLDRMTSILGEKVKKLPNTTGLFLLEKGRVLKAELDQFLQRNKDVHLLDLSTPKTPFSSMLNVNPSRLRGTTILLEHVSGSNIEEVVERFLTEAVSFGELCAVFTSKSTKLYRVIRGNQRIKIIAASSLVFAHDELPDGEIQIPDRELGLVTSIVSDLIETARGMPVCFVFDSIMELISGDQWELVYSGIKQIIEILALPNVTTVFIANQDIMEPEFLGALRSLFQVQLRLDSAGFRVLKTPTQALA